MRRLTKNEAIRTIETTEYGHMAARCMQDVVDAIGAYSPGIDNMLDNLDRLLSSETECLLDEASRNPDLRPVSGAYAPEFESVRAKVLAFVGSAA